MFKRNSPHKNEACTGCVRETPKMKKEFSIGCVRQNSPKKLKPPLDV